MAVLLRHMIVEEWRIHSSIFGSFMFILLPLLVVLFSAAAALSLPLFTQLMPTQQLVLVAHYLFVFFGLNIGAFGLMGKEFMNRRFGQASLIAYSSRSLPVSERRIFLDFLIKDILFYLLLWILPCVAGFALVSPVLSISLGYSLILLLTLSLSFLIGLAAVFLLSTIYAHSVKLLIGLVLSAAFAVLFFRVYLHVGILGMLPSYLLFYELSMTNLLLSLALFLIPAALSLIFLNVDYPEREKSYRNALDGLINRNPFTGFAPFMAKDYLDLSRSEGGLGKIIFSFIFPIVLIGVLLFAFLQYIPGLSALIMFSLFLGIITSTVYNWLTEYDLSSAYSFLPVITSTIMKSKIFSYLLFNALPVLVLLGIVIGTGQGALGIPALSTFISLSLYAVSVTVYFTGLHPNILLYNGKIFALYMASIAPLLLLMIFASLISPFILIGSLVLLPIAAFILKAGFAKWDRGEDLRF
jgi:hypothetical protein